MSNGASLAPQLIRIDFAVFPAANLYFLYCICNPKRYLYDIQNDPQQKNTLDLDNEENKQLAKTMEEDVIKWLKRQNDGFYKNWNSKL